MMRLSTRRIAFRSMVNLTLGIFMTAGVSSCGILGKKAARADETLSMQIREDADRIDYALLQRQDAPTLAARGSANARGIPLALAGGAVSLATNAIKKMIDDEQKKYTAEYTFALTDLYFYDQLSLESPFDPVGMQFNGFRIARLEGGNRDTALVADFELDTDNPYEIINNAVFRLKLSRIRINELKASMAPGSQDKANLDIEISIRTSYVNELGQLFDNVELGKFFLFLRKAPVGGGGESVAYYQRLEGKKLEGKSFIVPRSFGYRIAGSGGLTEPAFSQGSYSIVVKVKESTKDTFINKIISDNSDRVIEMLGQKAKEQFR